ncbi:MAG TPA: catalase [Polyangiaceae bacterium]|nr:catalase [Polyangiaceae bacterium]
MTKTDPRHGVTNDKLAELERDRARDDGTYLTTDQGVRLAHTDDSLKAGPRGPTLLEDFHLREKMTRFDHERIPERVVHARGSGAHGYFQVYESLAEYTSAGFLCDPSRKTPVFVRFSTVQGSRGSADTVRDVRGFATKFYTQEGNFDLVGNNIPVFFIQDGIKFPDVVHAVKPEPHHEMPQGGSAHDSFWDFVSLVPETAHMIMWVMSDRAIPRSYRMMEGFGVHTFRLVNAAGKTRLVKFHWKPVLGLHSLVWDEAQKIAGKDPDFHRRDLWEAIEAGAYPEYELGLQIIEENEAARFDFDLLDPTKLVPEELVPVRRVGKMVLNRNPDNFFAETEQVAYCVSNVVPGIDVTDDPLMQARLFSYLDTQLTRLGGPNHVEIPINRPIAPVHNHQQDGFHRQRINASRANYFPNSLGGGCPMAALGQGGYVHAPARTEGAKTRARSESFLDHFSQAAMFLHSMTPPERQHLVDACRFELGKVERKEIRERVIKNVFARIDPVFAGEVARAVGVAPELAGPDPLARGQGEAKPGKDAAAPPPPPVAPASKGGSPREQAEAVMKSHVGPLPEKADPARGVPAPATGLSAPATTAPSPTGHGATLVMGPAPTADAGVVAPAGVGKAPAAAGGAALVAPPRGPATSPALSMLNANAALKKPSIKTRQIAVLVAPGFDGAELAPVKKALEGQGAVVHIVSEFLGPVVSGDGPAVEANKSFLTASSVLFDAVYVPGGPASLQALEAGGTAMSFLEEAFRHCKPIGATGDAGPWVMRAVKLDRPTIGLNFGVVLGQPDDLKTFAEGFIAAIAEHRHWQRESIVPPRL